MTTKVEASNLLTPEQAAARLGIKPITLAAWRHYHSRKKRRPGNRPIPNIKFVPVGGRLIRYRPQDIDNYIASQLTDSTPPQKPQRSSPGRPRKSRAA